MHGYHHILLLYCTVLYIFLSPSPKLNPTKHPKKKVKQKDPTHGYVASPRPRGGSRWRKTYPRPRRWPRRTPVRSAGACPSRARPASGTPRWSALLPQATLWRHKKKQKEKIVYINIKSEAEGRSHTINRLREADKEGGKRGIGGKVTRVSKGLYIFGEKKKKRASDRTGPDLTQ